ncbi:c-type cytochrome [Alkalilimnicola ehrlichii MLHE-1]|uniref:Cytochrome c n=1 Tax=Alkalilimnicola ehrlichii (strain ATCC BAA-1101 / DSM 17681 / MLHE-1) TaxID=187272 RepID=Q0A9H6_ALKEH|nr:cytochrome c [Alkalilimnicola ehrlichii]ABI56511.1 cytochrome c [Alkalilimnicola ehrlichii MLHE-1]
MTGRWPTAALAAAAVLALTGPAAAEAPGDDPVTRGEYVMRAGGCVSCHTPRDEDAEFLAGGRALETPFGTFYGPNITPDPEYGLGDWSLDDFIGAMTEGRAPDGRHYYPVFPYTSYTRMRRQDLEDLWAYLQSLEPVSQPNRPHELHWHVRWRLPLAGWKWLNFEPGEFEPDPSRSETWNRGAYLVHALSHCAECHTPRTRTGGLDRDRWLAGARDGPEGETAPNITPHRETGIGRWSERHLVRYLDFGMDPDGDFAGGLMGEFIDESSSHLSDDDRRAIAHYILSLEPIEHAVD